MKRKLLKCTGLLIGLVFVLTLLPQASASVVWENNFDDISEWTVVWGEWRAENGILKTNYIDETIQRISHPSSQSVGRWSFDINQSHNTAADRTTVWFMTNGTDVPDENYGYGLRVNVDSIYLVKINGGWNDHQMISAAYFSPEPFHSTWTHFDVSRNSSGGIDVYINKTLSAEPDISTLDDDYNYSERLLIDFIGFHRTWIDNMVVDDEPIPRLTATTPTTPTTTTAPTTPTTPTTPTPPDLMILTIGAGAVIVVIVAAVIFMRRS